MRDYLDSNILNLPASLPPPFQPNFAHRETHSLTQFPLPTSFQITNRVQRRTLNREGKFEEGSGDGASSWVLEVEERGEGGEDGRGEGSSLGDSTEEG